jgi:mannose-6-phosphate isomerase
LRESPSPLFNSRGINELKPLKFIPILKRLRWGGRRLGDLLGKSIGPDADYAESWEVCDHGADQSVVGSGPWSGWSLRRLVREQGIALLGRHAGILQFPLLIKFLDARDRLSVQVHPNDDQARRLVPGECGKTEAWVILAAGPDSCVFAGLRPAVDEARLRWAARQGSIADCLHRVPVAAGDCLFIPAGTVHAIGEGIVLAEVQQSSNVTFRLFDWNRTGSDGKPRPLHLEQALACIDFSRGPVNKITPIMAADPGPHSEELVKCRYFTMRRQTSAEPITISDDRRCHIVMVLSGELHCAGSEPEGRQTLAVGETALVPASALPLTLVPQSPAVFLDVFWD